MSENSMRPAWLDWPETQALLAAFSAQPDALRFVGGAVRDHLLGISAADVDAATIHKPEQTIALLEKAGIRAIPTGIDHGTVTAVVGKRSFEITTLRKDTGCDGRHAQVEYTDSWQEDAKRRDFTMNALYLAGDGTLYDYFGGQADAQAGLVRFIGNAQERIEEDYLRILRFFRFYARFGKADPDSAALEACAKAAPYISELSAERIQKELLLLLTTQQPADTLKLMYEKGVLECALGFKLHDVLNFRRLTQVEKLAAITLPAHAALCVFIRSATMGVQEAQEALVADLRLSNAMAEDIEAIGYYGPQITADIDEAAQKRLIRQLGKKIFSYSVILNWTCSEDEIDMKHPYYAMLRLAQGWQVPVFPVKGADLLDAGLQEGKDIGHWLHVLEEAWETSGYQLGREELLKQVGA